jgi:hypothetical protein
VFPRLAQIRTIAGAVERDLALLAATLRTDASVECRTETLFLPKFADGAAQKSLLRLNHGNPEAG